MCRIPHIHVCDVAPTEDGRREARTNNPKKKEMIQGIDISIDYKYVNGIIDFGVHCAVRHSIIFCEMDSLKEARLWLLYFGI